jgi:hypothetical protein
MVFENLAQEFTDELIQIPRALRKKIIENRVIYAKFLISLNSFNN